MSGVGQYEHVVAKRAALTKRLSPTALHRNFPTLYARPIPMPNTDEAAKAEILVLAARNKELAKENEALVDANRVLQAEVDRYRALNLPSAPLLLRAVAIRDVFSAYVRALDVVGYRINETPYTMLDLLGASRARVAARPRHVAMWLCRRLCKGTSLPSLGKAFGGRDHTSVMHGCVRAPFIMEAAPILRSAALIVLAKFEEATPA